MKESGKTPKKVFNFAKDTLDLGTELLPKIQTVFGGVKGIKDNLDPAPPASGEKEANQAREGTTVTQQNARKLVELSELLHKPPLKPEY
jgi:hypothetical protein